MCHPSDRVLRSANARQGKDCCYMTVDPVNDTLKSIKDALNSPEWPLWKEAIETETAKLRKLGALKVVESFPTRTVPTSYLKRRLIQTEMCLFTKPGFCPKVIHEEKKLTMAILLRQ